MIRPTTPEAELARVLHADTYGLEHVEEWPTCCVWVEDDVNQAVRLIGLMDGWHLGHDLSLPTSAPSRGPRTSDTAAESIHDLNDRQWAVWWALEYSGPSTDEELVERYRSFAGPDDVSLCPPQTPPSIRSRRKELERAGHVRDTGQRRPTKTGRSAIVWQALGEAQVAA